MGRPDQFKHAARLYRLSGSRVSIVVAAILVVAVVPAWGADKADVIPIELFAKAEVIPADAVEETEPDPIERAHREEIIGSRGTESDRELRRFLEMVVLPLGICLALVLLLRGGISS